MPTLSRVVDASAPRAVALIRLAVGIVFTSEGLQKFLFPEALGAGRFAKIGIPAPELLGPFVGAVELACGLLILVGLLTRLAALPLLIDMLVALATTKVPILLERGIWPMLHEARTDLSMLLGATFLLLVGAGPASLDALIHRRLATRP